MSTLVLTLTVLALLSLPILLITLAARRSRVIGRIDASADTPPDPPLSYFRQVFSGDNCASFARYATLLTILTGCFILLYLVLHNHSLPDGAQILSLSAWMTAP